MILVVAILNLVLILVLFGQYFELFESWTSLGLFFVFWLRWCPPIGKIISENEFLVTFTFGFGEFESVCIPLLFTGCECQKRISCGTEKGHIQCICGATSEKDWDILAMLAACQVNKTLMEKVFVRSWSPCVALFLSRVFFCDLFWVNRIMCVALFLSKVVLVNFSGWIDSCEMENKFLSIYFNNCLWIKHTKLFWVNINLRCYCSYNLNIILPVWWIHKIFPMELDGNIGSKLVFIPFPFR